MKTIRFTYIGPTITDFNRSAVSGEEEGRVALTALSEGMRKEMYQQVNGECILKSDSEVGDLVAKRELASAKASKRAEILQVYADNEKLLTFDALGTTFYADQTSITEMFVEHELASRNGETEQLVFDINNEPHMVPLTAIVPALQTMRGLAKALRAKGKGYLVAIENATTVEEVEAVTWA